jgi:hypothetical protein
MTQPTDKPSKRFSPSKIQDVLVPVLLVVLAAVLITVIMLVALTMVSASA